MAIKIATYYKQIFLVNLSPLTITYPNMRVYWSQKSCLGSLCKWSTMSFVYIKCLEINCEDFILNYYLIPYFVLIFRMTWIDKPCKTIGNNYFDLKINVTILELKNLGHHFSNYRTLSQHVNRKSMKKQKKKNP